MLGRCSRARHRFKSMVRHATISHSYRPDRLLQAECSARATECSNSSWSKWPESNHDRRHDASHPQPASVSWLLAHARDFCVANSRCARCTSAPRHAAIFRAEDCRRYPVPLCVRFLSSSSSSSKSGSTTTTTTTTTTSSAACTCTVPYL